jgi:hypothetical protein
MGATKIATFQWFPYSQVCSRVSPANGTATASKTVSTDSASLSCFDSSDRSLVADPCQCGKETVAKEPWEPVVVLRQRRRPVSSAEHATIYDIWGLASNLLTLLQSRKAIAVANEYESADVGFQRAFNTAVLPLLPELCFHKWANHAVLKMVANVPRHGDTSVLDSLQPIVLGPGGALMMAMSNAASRILEAYIVNCSVVSFTQLARSVLLEEHCVSQMTSNALAIHPFAAAMRRLRQETTAGHPVARELFRHYRHLLSALSRSKCSFVSVALNSLRKAN